MLKAEIIIPTLLRDGLWNTVVNTKTQNTKIPFSITVGYDPEVNEYVSRDRAIKRTDADIIVFVDDDAYLEPNTLNLILEPFNDSKIMVTDGGIKGNVFGNGNVVFNNDHLGIGTALAVRRQAYLSVGGFKTKEWGEHNEAGWRMDTALLYDIIRKYGEESYVHVKDYIVVHPKPMTSTWNPYIEVKFALEYTDFIKKYILHLDTRIGYILINIDTLKKAIETLSEKEFNEICRKHNAGLIVPDTIEELKKVMASKNKDF